MKDDIDDAVVDAFWDAQNNRRHFPAEWLDRLSFEQAYRIQLAISARRVAGGSRQAGWKVAQTSAEARTAFGFNEPVFGSVMLSGVRRSGHVYGRGDLIHPRCEPEICVRLKSDLTGKIDHRMARQAIGTVYPAIEIIEVRGDIANQKALAIADNAATKDVVLGDAHSFDGERDLVSEQCRFQLNGDEALRGTGADILGGPLNSLVWLTEKLAQFDLGLRSGDLVMTGSMTQPVSMLPGDQAHATFSTLGSVRVEFAL